MYTNKVLICGDPEVGKTSIVQMIKNNKCPDEHIPTDAVMYYSFPYKSQDITYQINVWDTGGSENRKDLVYSYAKGIDVAILVFDLTNIQTLQHLEEWADVIHERAASTKPALILVGNKIDAEPISVTEEQVQMTCYALQCEYFEISARMKDSVDTLFNRVAQICIDRLNGVYTPIVVPPPDGAEANCCLIM